MKLGIVTGELPPMEGGVGDYTVALATAIAALGHEVHVVARRRCAGTVIPGVRVHGIVERWSARALVGVRALARTLGLDALLLEYQPAAFDLRGEIHLLPAVAGTPVVTTFHDLREPWILPLAGPLRRAAVTMLARTSAGAVASNPVDAAELRRRGALRVARIPIGSNIPCEPEDAHARAAIRARYGAGPEAPLLGHFGFLNETKGCDDLLLALARLAGEHRGARLVLIGGTVGSSVPSNRAHAAEIERLLDRHDLRDRVFATGFLPPAEVSAHLRACDLVVQPYRDGASSSRTTLMAALAHACAVVTTSSGKPDAAWRDGEHLRLVAPGDVPALASALAELLEDAGLRESLARNAARAVRDCAWERIAADVVDFVAGSLGRPRAGSSRASVANGSDQPSAPSHADP